MGDYELGCVNLVIQKITMHKSDFSDLDELSSAQSDVTDITDMMEGAEE